MTNNSACLTILMPKTDKILLDHGSGGKISHRLINEIMLPIFDNPILSPLNDGAIFDIKGNRIAFSTDTYVVDPIFFPGGNIGDLAINETINFQGFADGIYLYSFGFNKTLIDRKQNGRNILCV